MPPFYSLALNLQQRVAGGAGKKRSRGALRARGLGKAGCPAREEDALEAAARCPAGLWPTIPGRLGRSCSRKSWWRPVLISGLLATPLRQHRHDSNMARHFCLLGPSIAHQPALSPPRMRPPALPLPLRRRGAGCRRILGGPLARDAGYSLRRPLSGFPQGRRLCWPLTLITVPWRASFAGLAAVWRDVVPQQLKAIFSSLTRSAFVVVDGAEYCPRRSA